MKCLLTLAESIADGMSYKKGSISSPSTFSVWMEMLQKATSTVEIASFYWTLTDGVQRKYPTGDQGQKVFDELLSTGTKKKIKIKIVQSAPSKRFPSTDTDNLAKSKAAEVRSIDFKKLLGNGLLHTKLWLVDRKHAYIGSANSDWRSLTEVKEMGIYIKDCPTVGEDIGKIFDVYWMLAVEGAKVPGKFPAELATKYNKKTPIDVPGNGHVYLSSSPPQFCPEGRTKDDEAILSVISKAKKYIYVSVMDYYPLFIYGKDNKYWGVIHEALIAASKNNKVELRMLVSQWPQTRMDWQTKWLTDLVKQPGVKASVKIFIVPATPEQSKIDHARVNHNKFMVTDNSAYIGTSNWSADYFTTTGGVGVVVEGTSELRKQLEQVFHRDWDSEFAVELPMVEFS